MSCGVCRWFPAGRRRADITVVTESFVNRFDLSSFKLIGRNIDAVETRAPWLNVNLFKSLSCQLSSIPLGTSLHVYIHTFAFQLASILNWIYINCNPAITQSGPGAVTLSPEQCIFSLTMTWRFTVRKAAVWTMKWRFSCFSFGFLAFVHAGSMSHGHSCLPAKLE